MACVRGLLMGLRLCCGRTGGRFETFEGVFDSSFDLQRFRDTLKL
jgi:hypothetical protein